MKKILLPLIIYFSFLIVPADAFALLGFDFKIHSSVSTAYDDNVTFVKDNKKSDSVTNLKIGLGAKQEGKTYQFNVLGNITRHLFADNSSFNNNSQDINVDFQKEISKYDRISVSNRFVHAEDPQSFEDDFGRTSGRYSYYRNTFNTGYTRDVSKHISVQGHYGNENYSASRETIRDSLLHRVGADVIYFQSSATAFLMGYNFTTRHLEGTGNADVHTLSTGLRHSLTKQLYLDARGGVSFVEAYDGSKATEPNFVLVLTNDLNETDAISLSYRQTSTPSSFSADIFDSWRITANYKRQLLRRLQMTASVFFGEGEFDALGITDQQTGVSTRLSYDVKENTTAFMAYTFSEVDSNIDSRSYARNLVSVGVRMTF